MGQTVVPTLTLNNLVDIWLQTTTSETVSATIGSSAKDFMMVLSYSRKAPDIWMCIGEHALGFVISWNCYHCHIRTQARTQSNKFALKQMSWWFVYKKKKVLLMFYLHQDGRAHSNSFLFCCRWIFNSLYSPYNLGPCQCVTGSKLVHPWMVLFQVYMDMWIKMMFDLLINLKKHQIDCASRWNKTARLITFAMFKSINKKEKVIKT